MHDQIGKMLPHKWWRQFGGSLPALRRVAMKVLSVTTSATTSERAWSAQGRVCTKTRARLHVSRIEKLVKVASNMKMGLNLHMHNSKDEEPHAHLLDDDEPQQVDDAPQQVDDEPQHDQDCIMCNVCV